MQPVVLPTALDRTSAQVLGFDATAYITDTPSTLHQRLNVPGSLPQGDTFGRNLASVPKKKDHTNTILASLTMIGGALTLGILASKGKLKKFKLQNLKNIKIPTTSQAKQGIGKIFKDVKEIVSAKFKVLGEHFKHLGEKMQDAVHKFIKKK